MRNEVRKSGMNPIFKTSISQVFSGRYKRKIIVVDDFRLTSWFVYFDPVNGKLLVGDKYWMCHFLVTLLQNQGETPRIQRRQRQDIPQWN